MVYTSLNCIYGWLGSICLLSFSFCNYAEHIIIKNVRMYPTNVYRVFCIQYEFLDTCTSGFLLPHLLNFGTLLWAHGLHLLFSPVCPVYSALMPRLLPLLPRFPKTVCILWPQLINIQRLPKYRSCWTWPLAGWCSVSPVAWRVGYISKFAEATISESFGLPGFAWSGRRFRQSCRKSRGERTRSEAIPRQKFDVGEYRRLYQML